MLMLFVRVYALNQMKSLTICVSVLLCSVFIWSVEGIYTWLFCPFWLFPTFFFWTCAHVLAQQHVHFWEKEDPVLISFFFSLFLLTAHNKAATFRLFKEILLDKGLLWMWYTHVKFLFNLTRFNATLAFNCSDMMWQNQHIFSVCNICRDAAAVHSWLFSFHTVLTSLAEQNLS